MALGAEGSPVWSGSHLCLSPFERIRRYRWERSPGFLQSSQVSGETMNDIGQNLCQSNHERMDGWFPLLFGIWNAPFSFHSRVGESVDVKVRIDDVLIPPSSLKFSTPSDADHSPIWVCHLPTSSIASKCDPGEGGQPLHHEISFETEFLASSQGAQSSLTLPPGVLGVTYRRYQVIKPFYRRCLTFHQSMNLLLNHSIYLSIYLFIYLSIYLSIF